MDEEMKCRDLLQELTHFSRPEEIMPLYYEE